VKRESTQRPTVYSANSGSRIASIDILRALTMVLMIFVNDLWSLKNIPAWLEHVAPGVDGIGLADVVFPAFLFIVGLSLPYGIKTRIQKGDSTVKLIQHVLTRAFALVVMGLFLVNGEMINPTATGMPRQGFYLLSCLAFILIWNSYSKTTNRNLVWGLKGLGIAILLVLAFIYRGGEENRVEYFSPHWWGILGLIGWAYLASGIITVFARGNFYIILSSWLFFSLLSMISKAGMLPEFLSFIPDAIRGGTLTGLTLGGVLTASIFQHYIEKKNNRRLTLLLLGFSLILIVLSVITRPYWGLAKLGATPAWLFLCSAFTILAFLAVYWLVDVKGKANWFNVIRPAGTDTLLCYLIPYFAYVPLPALGIHLPEIALNGGVGLLKSFLFAILCVWIAGWLSKKGVRLKL
jgi:predicted acyltransferase